jgi:DNA repair exonuclease SbcCD ATPase subunit
MVGCGQQKANKDTEMTALRDSLNQIISQKDNEIDGMMETFNDIEAGFREIDAAEGHVALARQGEGANAKERIRENMEFIKDAMARNKELINKLRQQLRESTIKGNALKTTIENMMKQIEEKDKKIQDLIEELDAKDIHISRLDEEVANLNTNVSNLTEETNQKTQTINTQDKQLNTAWFVFGTKSELKQQHILEDGKVLQANFNQNYFTKIDIRVDKEIKLYSRSAKMMTSHPAGSYTLDRDANKQYILRISDPQKFWSTSKYLVILVK